MLKASSALALCATSVWSVVGASAIDTNAPRKDRFGFRHVSTESFTHPTKGFAVHTDTYLSLPMDLAPGEMVFTDEETTPLVMPPAKLSGYTILGFSGEIVDGNNVSAPLSDCYDHHWIAVQEGHENKLCGDPNYIVGIGAESRHTRDVFPDGYGYHVSPLRNKWAANIHLLHTVGLAGDDPFRATKECNECYYADTKGSECTPDQNGTFMCCGDSCPAHECFCPTAKGLETPQRTRYHLRYQVNYTYDVAEITPMDIGVITTPNCELFYGVYENDEEPETLSSTTWSAPADVELVYAVGHQHVGSLNISLFVNDEFICASYPRYGQTPGLAGDEQGYLVEMSVCLDKSKENGPEGKSVHIKKGDSVRLDSWYWVGSNDTRIYPHPGGTHLNVMAYMYMGYVSDKSDEASVQSWELTA